jgi:hypothetical protein
MAAVYARRKYTYGAKRFGVRAASGIPRDAALVRARKAVPRPVSPSLSPHSKGRRCAVQAVDPTALPRGAAQARAPLRAANSQK